MVETNLLPSDLKERILMWSLMMYYVESMKDYIKVVTANRNIIPKQTISSIEDDLPSRQFVRIHPLLL
ncbi:MAG: hypothetical protein C5B59_16550 [Bacteroidetes bacterium]|nr:MAG: hypothetical protein C5B59_16550 [Bacteroidota bacterium]